MRSNGRRIVVVGNDRCGCHWLLGPLEEILGEDSRFELVTARVSSGNFHTRTNTPVHVAVWA